MMERLLSCCTACNNRNVPNRPSKSLPATPKHRWKIHSQSFKTSSRTHNSVKLFCDRNKLAMQYAISIAITSYFPTYLPTYLPPVEITLKERSKRLVSLETFDQGDE